MPRPFKRKRSKFDDVRDQRRKARGEEARQNVKRRKVEGDHNEEFQDDFIPLDDGDQENPSNDDSVFYGFLTEDEQAYYASVNTKLTANEFEDEEDRRGFIEAIHRESNGKELKLASSQSCSRYLERIIQVSTPEQLLHLFDHLLEGLTHLSQHRFGSHVLETLFSESAKYIQVPTKKVRSEDETSSAFEDRLMRAATELEANVGYLLTDQFGSHVIRVLVLVLSGEPLQDASVQKVVASKKKEKVDAPERDNHSDKHPRVVPESFQTALSGLIAAAISGLDGTYLRSLATHPTGNPILRLLLKLELTSSDKGRSLQKDSLFQKLFSPDSSGNDAEGVKMVAGLTYDSTGSHLIETVVQYAPGKTFKKLYKAVWNPRLASMAKNDVASYVAVKILQRLGKDDLAEARDVLLPELPTLLERHRFTVIQALVDRCVVRGADLTPVAKALKASSGKKRSSILQTILQGDPSSADNAGTDTSGSAFRADIHGSMLAQSLLGAPEVSTLIQDSILATKSDMVISMAKDPSASRVLQAALTSSASLSAFRKQLIPKFYEHLAELATTPSGSYLVESLWDGTSGLHFMKERIAGEISKHEHELRDSTSGRQVWRNWLMDLYIRRHGEWQARAKGQDGDRSEHQSQGKSAIQLARERYAAERQSQNRPNAVRPDAYLNANG